MLSSPCTGSRGTRRSSTEGPSASTCSSCSAASSSRRCCGVRRSPPRCGARGGRSSGVGRSGSIRRSLGLVVVAVVLYAVVPAAPMDVARWPSAGARPCPGLPVVGGQPAGQLLAARPAPVRPDLVIGRRVALLRALARARPRGPVARLERSRAGRGVRRRGGAALPVVPDPERRRGSTSGPPRGSPSSWSAAALALWFQARGTPAARPEPWRRPAAAIALAAHRWLHARRPRRRTARVYRCVGVPLTVLAGGGADPHRLQPPGRTGPPAARPSWVATVGRHSYSLYLWHIVPVLLLASPARVPKPVLGVTAVVATAALTVRELPAAGAARSSVRAATCSPGITWSTCPAQPAESSDHARVPPARSTRSSAEVGSGSGRSARRPALRAPQPRRPPESRSARNSANGCPRSTTSSPGHPVEDVGREQRSGCRRRGRGPGRRSAGRAAGSRPRRSSSRSPGPRDCAEQPVEADAGTDQVVLGDRHRARPRRRRSASIGCGLTTSWMPRSPQALEQGWQLLADRRRRLGRPASDQRRTAPTARVRRNVGIHTTKSPVMPSASSASGSSGLPELVGARVAGDQQPLGRDLEGRGLETCRRAAVLADEVGARDQRPRRRCRAGWPWGRRRARGSPAACARAVAGCRRGRG